MTLQDLGEKLNITKQGVKDIQDREKTGGVTIKALESIAMALGYKFEYRFIPRTNMEN